MSERFEADVLTHEAQCYDCEVRIAKGMTVYVRCLVGERCQFLFCHRCFERRKKRQ